MSNQDSPKNVFSLLRELPENKNLPHDSALVAASLGVVTGLPITDMVQIMDEQPTGRRLDRLLRSLVNGDINHPLWTDSAKARLSASISLHLLAAKEPLRQPLPSYEWHLFESYVVAELSGRSRETFVALFLDTQYRLISNEVLFMGSVDSAPVYTRVVASRALVNHASFVVVAHNHPSGVLTPSHSDVAVTQKLSKALMLLDIRLLDHLIAAEGRCVSLRNLGFV
jgi:DNA repair protein RadC